MLVSQPQPSRRVHGGARVRSGGRRLRPHHPLADADHHRDHHHRRWSARTSCSCCSRVESEADSARALLVAARLERNRQLLVRGRGILIGRAQGASGVTRAASAVHRSRACFGVCSFSVSDGGARTGRASAERVARGGARPPADERGGSRRRPRAEGSPAAASAHPRRAEARRGSPAGCEPDAHPRRPEAARGLIAGRRPRRPPSPGQRRLGPVGGADPRAGVGEEARRPPSATKMPHSIPEVVAYWPWLLVPCLSKIRQTISTHVHRPAAMITPPSPPGTWNARPSARWNRSVSTPTATSRTAASTNEKLPSR